MKYNEITKKYIKQGINYQWTPGDNNEIMQQMSMIAIKVKNSILINK